MSTYRERVAEYERMYRASDSPPLTAREAGRLAVIDADLINYTGPRAGEEA